MCGLIEALVGVILCLLVQVLLLKEVASSFLNVEGRMVMKLHVFTYDNLILLIISDKLSSVFLAMIFVGRILPQLPHCDLRFLH